jgi:site-specific recombinase XerC
MNGLRISEALGADIDDLDIDRGHRTLRMVRKGGKQVTIPLAPDPAGRQLHGALAPLRRVTASATAVIPCSILTSGVRSLQGSQASRRDLPQ